MIPELHDAHAVLTAARYAVEMRDVEGLGCVLLAETPYAFVMTVPVPDVDEERFVNEAQASLTQLAAVHPSPRNWDLYLVLVASDAEHYERIRKTYEADTRYARKLVVTGDLQQTEQLLRSLLPLRPLAELEHVDPLSELRRQLMSDGLDQALVEEALSSFEATAECRYRDRAPAAA